MYVEQIKPKILFRTPNDVEVSRHDFFIVSSMLAIVRNNEVVGTIKYKSHNNHVIEIENIVIDRDKRRKGIGTEAVLHLKELYPKGIFTGVMLYEGAFDFWRQFDKALGDYFPGDGTDCWFEFK